MPKCLVQVLPDVKDLLAWGGGGAVQVNSFSYSLFLLSKYKYSSFLSASFVFYLYPVSIPPGEGSGNPL